MQEFVRRYGNKATHLNAFFIEKHFNTFKRILGEALDGHWDELTYQEMVGKYDVEPDDPDELGDIE